MYLKKNQAWVVADQNCDLSNFILSSERTSVSQQEQVHLKLSMKLILELNTPAALKLVPMCHLGPRTRKIEIWHPELVKLCHLGP